MKITSAILCDFAQTRDGLLFVSSGNITRVWREVYPAPLGVMLALSLSGDLGQSSHSGKLSIRLRSADEAIDREVIAGELGFESESPGHPAIFELIVPLHDLPVPQPDVYSIDICFDGNERVSLPFSAVVANDNPS